MADNYMFVFQTVEEPACRVELTFFALLPDQCREAIAAKLQRVYGDELVREPEWDRIKSRHHLSLTIRRRMFAEHHAHIIRGLERWQARTKRSS